MSHTTQKAAFSLTPWKRLWPYLRAHGGYFAGLIASNLLIAVFDFYRPLLQSEVIDRFILAGTLDGLTGYALFYSAVIAAEFLSLLVNFKCCMGMEMYTGRDLKDACFVNLQRLSLEDRKSVV